MAKERISVDAIYFGASRLVCFVCGKPATLLNVTSFSTNPPDSTGPSKHTFPEQITIHLCGPECIGYVKAAIREHLAYSDN